jgi:hypothetical protein
VCYERLYRVMTGKTTTGQKDFPWAQDHKSGLGSSLDVFNLKKIDCSILTKAKLYNEIQKVQIYSPTAIHWFQEYKILSWNLKN